MVWCATRRLLMSRNVSEVGKHVVCGGRWLTTAPGMPTTHWFQLRCVLEQPVEVGAGEVLQGELHLQAHNRQSYDIYVTLEAPAAPGRPAVVVCTHHCLDFGLHREVLSQVLLCCYGRLTSHA